MRWRIRFSSLYIKFVVLPSERMSPSSIISRTTSTEQAWGGDFSVIKNCIWSDSSVSFFLAFVVTRSLFKYSKFSRLSCRASFSPGKISWKWLNVSRALSCLLFFFLVYICIANGNEEFSPSGFDKNVMSFFFIFCSLTYTARMLATTRFQATFFTWIHIIQQFSICFVWIARLW